MDPEEPHESDDAGCAEPEEFVPEDDEPELPRSFWAAGAEVVGGFVALFLLAIGVLTLYVASGVFLGLLAWAAPAVLAVAAALVLGRYLSRR